MTILTPARPRMRPRGQFGQLHAWPWGPMALLMGAAAIAVAAWLHVSQSLPHDAMLPAMAMLFFALGALTAGVAWSRQYFTGSGLTYWDVAGVLVLVGICATAAVEPDQMVRLVAASKEP